MEIEQQCQTPGLSGQYLYSSIIVVLKVKQLILKLILAPVGLIIGSFILFYLSHRVPFDAIESKLINRGLDPDDGPAFEKEYTKLYLQEKKHYPLFYFSISPSNSTPPNIEYDNIRYTSKKFQAADAENQKSFYYPMWQWHGIKNQYHLFIGNMFSGNWGRSLKDDAEVFTKFSNAFTWTLVSLIISLMISIPLSVLLSVYLAKNKNKWMFKGFSVFASLVFSTPAFMLATFVLIFLTGNQYGMPIFYSPLYLPIQDNSFMEIIRYGLPKLAPLIFCHVLTDLVFLTYLTTNLMVSESGKTYVIAARSRGFSEKHILLHHILPNAMIPMVTLIVHAIPVALAGSVVYELVFNVPGMGKLLYDGVHNSDWNLVYPVVMVIMAITIGMYWMGDILYQRIDPRVK